MRVRILCAILVIGWLGLYQGQLALWDRDTATPAHIFPYREQTYSPADRDALNSRIPFNGNQERSRLLEDYLS